MGSFTNNSLDLIRRVFRRDQMVVGASPEVVDRMDFATRGMTAMMSQAYGPLSGGVDTYMHDTVSLNHDLVSRFEDYEQMDEFCIAGDSLVRTLHGPIRIDQLASRYKAGERFKVIAYDETKREFCIADAHSPRKTKTDKVIELVMDTGDVLRCTPDHKVMRRDGTWVEAGSLLPGDSVMPLNTHVNKSGYLRICHPEKSEYHRWEPLYKVVARAKYGNYEKESGPISQRSCVHHLDENKFNDAWDNIQVMTMAEHYRVHQPDWTDTSANLAWTEENRLKRIERNRLHAEAKAQPKMMSWEKRPVVTDRPFKPRKGKSLDVDCLLREVRSSFSLSEASRKLQISPMTIMRRLALGGFDHRKELAKEVNNHKVLFVRDGGVEDVYDLTVDQHHNFVANNIVVHNCEISTALDLFADDATVQDVLDGKSLWFEAPDTVVSDVLNNMLDKQLRAEEELWSYARNLCKYGNNYLEIIALDQQGVIDLKPMYVPATRRIQDQEGVLYGYVHDPALGFSITTAEFFDRIKMKDVENPMKLPMPQMEHTKVFEPWEVVHFRMQGSNVSDIYGVSITDAARYAWKRLMMMEDAMLVFRLTRSPQRYAFYVDVGDVPPAQAKRLLQQVKNDFKKEKVVDKDGKVSFKYSPLAADEDFFLAVRKEKRVTEVEVLSSPDGGQMIEDVNYFKEKLIASLKIPKSYLAGDDTVGRANLAQLDVRMARSVMRVQRVMKNGYHQIARVDLAAKNIDPDMVEYSAMMNIPSGVLEMAQVEVKNAKLDLSEKYRAAGFSQYYIWSRVLGLSEDEIQTIREQLAVEQGATQTQSESVKRVITMDVDHGERAAKKLDKYANQIKEDIAKGQSEFGKRMRELKLLMNEVKLSMSKQRGTRWMPEDKR